MPVGANNNDSADSSNGLMTADEGKLHNDDGSLDGPAMVTNETTPSKYATKNQKATPLKVVKTSAPSVVSKVTGVLVGAFGAVSLPKEGIPIVIGGTC